MSKREFLYTLPNCSLGNVPKVTVRDWVTAETYRDREEAVDDLGRPVQSALVGVPGGNVVQNRAYGEWSQVTSVEVPHREGAQAYATSYGYTGAAPASVTVPSSGTITYAHNANARTVTNTDGKKRQYTYQEDGKVSQVVEEDGTGQLTVATNYGYDGLGRLVTITQGSQTRTIEYDDMGWRLSETHPESGRTEYTYDENWNVLTKKDALGIVTTFTYDDLNRVTARSYSDGTPSVSYTFDVSPGGAPIAVVNPVGRLVKVKTTTGGVTVM